MPARPGLNLKPNLTRGSQLVDLEENSWRLEIPAGPQGRYRLAQLDDYGSRPRRKFPWKPPLRFSLLARASAEVIPGTWGFGLWNNPFGMAILSGAEVLRLPCLPEATWFFFASRPNFLSLRDDLPAQGFLAATFRSTPSSSLLLALGVPALPLLVFPPSARLLRRLASRYVLQDGVALDVSVCEWHAYSLEWLAESVLFQVDGQTVLETPVAPRAPLGLVLWLDNQYAAFEPGGRLRFGTLPTPNPSWIEIKSLEMGCPSVY